MNYHLEEPRHAYGAAKHGRISAAITLPFEVCGHDF